MLIKNPKNDQVLRELPRDSAQQLADKVTRARRAQPGWQNLQLKERLATIERFRDAVVKHKDELALTLTREMGKPISQSKNELSATPARIGFFLEHTASVLAEEEVHREAADGTLKLAEVIRHEPLGVVLNISAWNYPWFVGTNVFIPALLTGNSVIYKPSEHATLTGLEIERLLHESGVPRDVFTAVVGEGDVGAELLDHDFNGVFFTGSYRTGKKIAERVAGRLIKVGLELGGKDPTYVTDDVDVKAAAESLADGAMYNAGQSCCSVERIYVHSGVAEAFQKAFVESVSGFDIGDPEDPKTYIGPLARREQLDELDRQVADALERGARLLIGGKRVAAKPGYFEPTVLVGVTDEMRVMREESFGPIIGIATVANDDEALARMNDNEYGLTAGVYSRDQKRAEALLGRVNAGSVYWNCCDRVSPRLPWTGRGRSGLGSTLSTHGIRSFLQPKAWHLRAP